MAVRMGTATLLSVLMVSVFACAATSAPPASAPAETPLAVVPREPTLKSSRPPPIPHASLEYEGRQYQGERGSYCWPVSQNSSVCADAAWWERFDEQSPVLVKRESGFKVVIAGDEPSAEQVRVEVFTVLETGPRARLGESVHSADVQTVPALDLPPGVYFLSVFLKFELGDVSYGFKIQVVE